MNCKADESFGINHICQYLADPLHLSDILLQMSSMLQLDMAFQ